METESMRPEGSRETENAVPHAGDGEEGSGAPIVGEFVDGGVLVTLEKPVHGGAVLARHPDGRALFVRGGIPGEQVVARITADHKRHAWAEVVEVRTPSEHRIDHVWPEAAAAGVGGVELGHVSPTYQREWKTQVLADTLRRIGGEEVWAQVQALPEPLVVRGTPRDEKATENEDERLLNRRVRIQLNADAQKRLGMKKFRSSEVVPTPEVPVAAEAINNMGALSGKRWRKLWNSGQRVSVEAPDVGPAVVVTKRGVFQKPGERGPARSAWRVPYGGETYKFETTAGGFWQTHREAPEVLVGSVMRGADPQVGERVAELYSGAGLFTRFLGDAVAPSGKVVSLEGNRRAVSDAGENLADLVASGVVEVFEGSVTPENIQALFSELGGEVNTVVLDPPRSGASSAVVAQICSSGASKVVLVSCDVAAGSRDLADFVSGGFTVQACEAWDLFPHTHHTEFVATLTRG